MFDVGVRGDGVPEKGLVSELSSGGAMGDIISVELMPTSFPRMLFMPPCEKNERPVVNKSL